MPEPEISDNKKIILELKDTLQRTEEEIVDKDKKLIDLLEQDSAKNDLISALKDKLGKLEEENDAILAKIETEKTEAKKTSASRSSDIPEHVEEMLANKEKKVQFLLSKLKEKEALNKHIAQIAYGHNGKTELLSDFNSRIERLEKENEDIKTRLIRKDKELMNLISKSKEKERIIEKIEEEKRILAKKPSFRDEEKLKILFKKTEEKGKIINELAHIINEKKAELEKKETMVISMLKQKKERDILVERLNEEVEKGHQFNKKLFKEANELRAALKSKSKKEADLESELMFLKKKENMEKSRIEYLSDENNSLKKRLSLEDEQSQKSLNNLVEQHKAEIANLKKDNEKYEIRIRKLLKENAEKEIAFREKISRMKDMLEKQNYLVIEKERKEKEILEEINGRFTEIFTLKNEIKAASKNEEDAGFFKRDEFRTEDVNNMVSLMRIGLAHNDSLDDIKKSLHAAGYDSALIDMAAKAVGNDDPKKR